jgi:DNA repair protein RecO
MKWVEGMGFVLRRIPYGETSLVVTLYSDTVGKIAFLVKGGKKGIPSRYHSSYFEPLNRLHFFTKIVPHRSLHYFNEVELSQACLFYSATSRILGGVTCDLFTAVVREELVPDARLYRFLTLYTDYISQLRKAPLKESVRHHFNHYWVYLPYLTGFATLQQMKAFRMDNAAPIRYQIEQWCHWCQSHVPEFYVPKSMEFIFGLLEEDIDFL